MPQDTYEPLFLPASDAASRGGTFVDAFDRQIKELFFIENGRFIGTDKEAAYASLDFAAYAESKKGSAIFVHYPWLDTTVKTVGKDDYLRLKTNRNQDLITKEEQACLRDYRVAVFGLSVGSNVAFTLTQAGMSNAIIIADFDELDTTNLNRIMAGAHQIGLNKAVIAARHIYEDNPFAEVDAHTEGINEDALRQLLDAKKIDCIIDEVDDMPFKVACRKLAMHYGVPVVMVTDNGDGVVLHVERYDLGLKTIFGKDPSHFDGVRKSMSREEAGRFIMEDIVGGVDRVDPAMLRSVQRVLSKELVSWSQLGSAAILGGVAVTYALKQIALGTSSAADIRAHISPAAISWGTHTA